VNTNLMFVHPALSRRTQGPSERLAPDEAVERFDAQSEFPDCETPFAPLTPFNYSGTTLRHQTETVPRIEAAEDNQRWSATFFLTFD
jgi:hypothetical protein